MPLSDRVLHPGLRRKIMSADAAAALIQALDLIISVPNTNAHLAGALGTPVWIMLNAAPEWRWQAQGTASPWYPSARLWRAERANVWGDVVAAVRRGLEDDMAALAARALGGSQ